MIGSRLRVVTLILLTAVLGFATFDARAQAPQAKDTFWYKAETSEDVRVKLHFFWSETCPHCARALSFLEPLGRERPWLLIQSYEVTESPENRALFATLAAELGEEIRGVPTFFLCGRMVVGFDNAEGSGAALGAMADACRAFLQEELAVPPVAEETAPPVVDLPLLGRVDAGQMSLPVLTVILGGLDAFNPCAFFVLLFLLSLLVHARSRARMVLVGGIFVLFSGLLYFVFMAAWLNLFLVLEGVRAVTLVAGAVAVALALVNIKDFFWFRRGPSLTIPEHAKPGLFDRMRGLISADNLPALLVGTVTLAIAANTYELLCTSGLPMVYTRALTLSELSTSGYYLYLALYNVIYILPLLAILCVFTFSLGGRKLSEFQGRMLKLLSGVMMLGLGLVLLAAPDLLDNWLTAVGLLAVALAATAGAYALERLRAV
ncbi:MAG: thioredoxin family protein [Kiloniellales bacterium]|nr:thioredoxin family protein [Kiloniellales bacterium]